MYVLYNCMCVYVCVCVHIHIHIYIYIYIYIYTYKYAYIHAWTYIPGRHGADVKPVSVYTLPLLACLFLAHSS